MPTITPQARVQVNPDPENFQQPRRTIKVSTGMVVPEKVATVDQTKIDQTGQSGTTEVAPGPAVTLSPQLTAIARRQQKLQQEIQAQRDKEMAWEKEKASYVPKDSLKAKFQQNADEAIMEAFGITYEELTNTLIAQKNGVDPVQELTKKIEKLETDQKDNVSKQYDATINQYKREANELVSKDSKKYFLINKKKAQDAVVQHIVDSWEENPDNVLTIEQAASEVEEFLREEAKQEKAYLEELEGPKEVIQDQAQKRLPPPKTAAPRTLSQSVETGTATRVKNQFQHMSMKERIAAATSRAQK